MFHSSKVSCLSIFIIYVTSLIVIDCSDSVFSKHLGYAIANEQPHRNHSRSINTNPATRRCNLNESNQKSGGRDGVLCSFKSPQLDGFDRVDRLNLSCSNETSESDQITCKEALSKYKLCKVDLALKVEPTGPITSFLNRGGCMEGEKIEFMVYIKSGEYKHKDGIRFNHDFKGNLTDLFISGTDLDSKQMADLISLNFYMANQIRLMENPLIEELPLDLSNFTKLTNLQIINNTNYRFIRSGNLKLGKNMTILVIKDLDFSKGKLEQGSIVIEDPRCRGDLKIEMVFNNLNAEAFDDDPFLIGDTSNNCTSDDNLKNSSLIRINLKNNSFSNQLPERMFKNLLLRGPELKRYNKRLELKTDPIDCCDPINSWLFNETGDYRSYFNSSCLPSAKDTLQLYEIKNIAASCSRQKSNNWKVYGIIVGVLVALLCTICYIYSRQQDKTDRKGTQPKHHHHHHHHRSHSKSESAAAAAAAGRRPDNNGAGAGTSGGTGSGSGPVTGSRGKSGRSQSSRRATKSPEANSKKKSNGKAQKEQAGKQVLSRKSDGTVLYQADDSAVAKSPTSPKFVRLISPGRRPPGT